MSSWVSAADDEDVTVVVMVGDSSCGCETGAVITRDGGRAGTGGYEGDVDGDDEVDKDPGRWIEYLRGAVGINEGDR